MRGTTSAKLRVLIVAIVASAGIGAAYSAAFGVLPAPRSLMAGAMVGATICATLAAFELFLLRGGVRGPVRRSFRSLMIMRLLAYTGVIFAVLAVVPPAFAPAADPSIASLSARDVAFSFAASFVVMLSIGLTELVGPRVLVNFAIGRYAEPRLEQRILLFADVAGSTALAERIGDLRFHELLADTFDCLAQAVVDAGGEVHKYVGDEMIAQWPVRTAALNARPAEAVFDAMRRIDAWGSHFRERYGQVPQFRAGLHLGTVAAGEVGDFRREVAFLGDAMNTAARIEQICRELDRPVLASEAFVASAMMPSDIVVEAVGNHPVRGKSEPLRLFSLHRRPNGAL